MKSIKKYQCNLNDAGFLFENIFIRNSKTKNGHETSTKSTNFLMTGLSRIVNFTNVTIFACLLLFLLSSIVSRLILNTNLHVEIIVNHMFYEHQSCLFIVNEIVARCIHFVLFLFPLFKSMIMCYFIAQFWLFENFE